MSKVQQIIKLFFQHEHPEDVQSGFFRWMSKSTSTAEKDAAMQQIWEELEVEKDASTETSYYQVLDKIGRPRTRIIPYTKLAKVAAVLLLAVLSAVFTYRYTKNKQPDAPELATYVVPNGEIGKIVLPDSSIVTANSGTVLIYAPSFSGKNRKVYLIGEAKFDIRKNQHEPFIVKTNDLEVEVLGTVFNVSAYADNGQTVATLASGKIKVAILSNEKEFVLRPDQAVAFDRATGKAVQANVKAENALAWENGQLIFQNATLPEIIKQLERRYNVSIYLNSQKAEEENLTVKFISGESIESVLGTLQQIVPGLKYKIDGKKIFMSIQYQK